MLHYFSVLYGLLATVFIGGIMNKGLNRIANFLPSIIPIATYHSKYWVTFTKIYATIYNIPGVMI